MNDPVGVWRLPKDEAIRLLPADQPLGRDIREFHSRVQAYYVDTGRPVDAALELIAVGVKFLEAARDWYLAGPASGV